MQKPVDINEEVSGIVETFEGIFERSMAKLDLEMGGIDSNKLKYCTIQSVRLRGQGTSWYEGKFPSISGRTRDNCPNPATFKD